MYKYIYIYTCVCMYVCMYAHTYACTCTCMYVCMYVYIKYHSNVMLQFPHLTMYRVFQVN